MAMETLTGRITGDDWKPIREATLCGLFGFCGGIALAWVFQYEAPLHYEFPLISATAFSIGSKSGLSGLIINNSSSQIGYYAGILSVGYLVKILS